MPDHESAALSFTWNAVDATCGDTSFSFDHYAICWTLGTAAPTAPSGAGVGCAMVGNRLTTTVDYFLHRSDQDFATAIFACDDSTCTDWFGSDGGENVYANQDLTVTDPEIWVMEDIEDYDDTDRTISGTVTASTALFYPSGWTHANKMAIWWSSNGTGTERIGYKAATDSGWQSWNTYSGWTSPVTVSEGIDDAAGIYKAPTHPWAVAAETSTPSRYIRLFLQVGESAGGPPLDVISVDSIDENGADFQLECEESGGCEQADDGGTVTCELGHPCDFDDVTGSGTEGPAEMVLCSDETVGCQTMSNAGHGRIAWDYIAYGGVDFSSDEPQMVFTGDRGGGSCTSTLSSDDIFLAEWDTSGETWNVAADGGCPDPQVENHHDPGLIPLPNGQYKMYALGETGTNNPLLVYFWDGSNWDDGTEVIVRFDDSTTWGGDDVDYDCIENVDMLVWASGGPAREGAFVRADTFNSGCFSDDGIVFMEHRN